MKIRLQKGSLRFRLRQADAQTLATSGLVREDVAVGTQTFSSTLELCDGSPELVLDGPRLIARIPGADARRWHTGAEVGLYYSLPEGTRLMVEKDWPCLDPAPGENEDDTFVRPSTPRLTERSVASPR